MADAIIQEGSLAQEGLKLTRSVKGGYPSKDEVGLRPKIVSPDWLIVHRTANVSIPQQRSEHGLRYIPSRDKAGRVIPGEYVACSGHVSGGGLPPGGPVAANIRDKAKQGKSQFEY